MTTITVNPTASAHDVREASGTMSLTSNVLTSGAHWVGLFLPSVTVPVGATINSATLYYKSVDAARVDPNIVWYANDVDDAAVFTTAASNVSSRAPTAASVTDSATGIGTTNYRTVTITSLIAEVTARGGWASGNDIALLGDCQAGCALEYGHYDGGANVWYVEIDYTTSSPVTVSLNTLSAALSAVSLTVAPGVVAIVVNTLSAVLSSVQMAVAPGARAVALNTLAAVLEAIDLTIGAGAVAVELDTLIANLTAVPLAPTSGSFTLDIVAGEDDGQEGATDGYISLSTGSVSCDAISSYVGLIFRNAVIPAGATITNAYLNVYPYFPTTDSPNLTIRGQFNPADFTTTAYDLSSRTKTAASVSWIASNIGTFAYKASPDISAVLNEIVATEGWESGDDLAFFFIRAGASEGLAVAAYDHATYPPPQLVVEWEIVQSSDVTIPLDTLTGAAAAVSLTVAPGAVSQLLDTLAVALTLEAADVAPGAVDLLLSTLSAAAGHVALSVAPGVVNVALNSLSVQAAAVTLAPIPGGVAILLSTHSATLQAIAVSVQSDASYIALNTLTGAMSVVSLGVVPGEVVASLNTLIGLLQVMELTVGQGIVLSTLSAALSAAPLTVAPGEVAVTLASLVPVLQAVGLSVAPGAVSVDLDTLNALLTLIAAIDTPDAVDVTIVLSSLMAALSVTDLGAIPGDMVIELQTMAAHMTLYDLIVFLMLGYAMHGTRAMSKATMTDYAPLLIRLGDTEGRD